MPNEEVGKYLRMALALERKNYRDYKKSAEETELQSIRKMFEFLAAEEEKHVALIMEKMEQFGVLIEDE